MLRQAIVQHPCRRVQALQVGWCWRGATLSLHQCERGEGMLPILCSMRCFSVSPKLMRQKPPFRPVYDLKQVEQSKRLEAGRAAATGPLPPSSHHPHSTCVDESEMVTAERQQAFLEKRNEEASRRYKKFKAFRATQIAMSHRRKEISQQRSQARKKKQKGTVPQSRFIVEDS